MVRLREIPRTAAFAWSPGTELPLLATGTRAGAVDADFSNDTELELWDLGLGPGSNATELQPAATISTDSRFHDIAWGGVSAGQPRGLIAGGLESGALDIWSAKELLDKGKQPLVTRTTNHSGAIKALQFNPFKPELLATAGAKGELYISDINNISNPFRLGNPATRGDDIEAADWNKGVAHILATGGNGGFITVWDLKARKENLTFNNLGRRPVSALVWDPDSHVRMITASPDDQNTDILVWDLRNTNAPAQRLSGHDQGVLSLSWCKQDSELLLSCGKDNRTICWNPRTGAQLGEFPVVANWTFQTRWNPHNPSLIATASFDGKISIQSLQSTGPAAAQPDASLAALDAEDFFNKPQAVSQGNSFTLPKAPKWLERPSGVSFGFGGKIVSFGLEPAVTGKPRSSKLKISQFSADAGVGTASEAFEKSISTGDFTSICESRIESAATSEEQADWKVIETLISADPRKKLLSYIGLDKEQEEVPETTEKSDPEASKTNGSTEKSNRLSAFFDGPGDDDFLTNTGETKPVVVDSPFNLFTSDDSAVDKKITNALLLGHFEKALDLCLKEDRLSDAFMIAICGGQKCLDKVQQAFLTSKTKRPNYVRLLASVAGKDLTDVVHNADLLSWKEIIAIICTYSDAKDFPNLCELLGDRLLKDYSAAPSKSEARKDASFCYLAGSKLEKVVKIWIDELHENEQSGIENTTADSSFSIHAQSLQALIEKVTVFREVTKFRDPGQDSTTSSWKLAPLYDIYTEYADVIAAHGFLSIAEKYLDLIPVQYSGAELAQNRVKLASKKAATAQKALPVVGRTASRAAPVATGYPPVQQTQSYGAPAPAPAPAPVVANPYTPSANAYNPPGYKPAANAYTPSGYQPAGNQGYQPNAALGQTPQQYGGYGFSAPPRNTNTTSSMPPPSRSKDMENWNDTPIVTKGNPARRNTPSVPITSPFPSQSPVGGQAAVGPPSGPPKPGPPSGPPRGPPRTGSTPSAPPSSFQPAPPPERPPSTSQYAPVVPPNNFAHAAPSIPRGASPYNAPPPTSAPPSNRYAPAAPASPEAGFQGSRAGPPGGSQYAPFNTMTTTPQNQGPPGPPRGPPQGPPRGPPQGPPQAAGGPPGPPPAASKPPSSKPKHPAGDRSHIADEARPVFELLDAEMQRVKPLAPENAKPQVIDTEKRLAILYDHLNNDDLLKPDTVQSMVELAQALANKDINRAQQIHVDIVTNKPDECGQWMVGVKRLIRFTGATK